MRECFVFFFYFRTEQRIEISFAEILLDGRRVLLLSWENISFRGGSLVTIHRILPNRIKYSQKLFQVYYNSQIIIMYYYLINLILNIKANNCMHLYYGQVHKIYDMPILFIHLDMIFYRLGNAFYDFSMPFDLKNKIIVRK